MEEKLKRLYNTMCTVETKGESTKTMGLCLQFVEQLIKDQAQFTKKCEKPVKEETNND